MAIIAEKILENPENILKHLSNNEVFYVYLGGSIMEGFGNDTSDIDVYVICEKIPQQFESNKDYIGESFLSTGENLVRNLVFDGVRYDFEYWTKEDFYNLIDRLNNLVFKTEDYISRFTDSEIDLLHRLKFGKALVNKENFNKLQQSILFKNLGLYQAIIASEKFTSYVEDIQGAMLSSDFGSAFFMVRRLLELAVTSYLAVHGETNPNSKWMYRKIVCYQERNRDKELLDKYLHFQTYPFNESTIKLFVKETMRFSQTLNVKTQNVLRNHQLS
ncbi:hypothetical protein [Bacillus sp. 03113]|uniref:hypothetical protein n=1 Tax=Bacillus sp. 03113 TaxID=2578211 RepID=UPI0011440186|nr:hypothetical protein [Bacillus sp. 03113]